MESMETPSNGTDTSEQNSGDRILVVHLDKRSDATSPTKVQPIKLVIPSSTGAASKFAQTNSKPTKMIISPVHLSTQPRVSVKLGSNQLNVKMVTNTSLIQNSLTSPTANGVTELPTETHTISLQNSKINDPSSATRPNLVEESRDESPGKMNREQKQLQNSINSSLVLSQMIIEGSTTRKSRGRKKKSQSPKQTQDPSISPETLSRSKSMEVLSKEGTRRSRSRNLSRSSSLMDLDSENDQEGGTPKRHNMRSANAEFAQKQKIFMKEIIKTQESADEGSEFETRELVKSNSNKSMKIDKSIKVDKNMTIDKSLPQAPKVTFKYNIVFINF